MNIAALWLQSADSSGGGGAAVVFLLLLVVVAVVAVLIVASANRRNPGRALKSAEVHNAAGRRDQARKDFQRAIGLFEAGKGTADERSRLYGRACAMLGALEEQSGRRVEAFDCYRKARQVGALLPPQAFVLLADSYAEAKSAGEDALRIYLEFMTSSSFVGDVAVKVQGLVYNLCQVTEEMKAAPRRTAADLCRRVVGVRPDAEWAHYFLGLATLLDGHAAEARESFVQAQRLNPERTLTYYWLAACLLQQPEPDVPQAMATVDRYLQFPAQDSKQRRRQARACSEVAQRVIGLLGGFDTTIDCSSGARREWLNQAIVYFTKAVEITPDDAEAHFRLGSAWRLLVTEWAKALGYLSRAVELAPGEKQYAYSLASLRHDAGDSAGAVEALRIAIAADANYADAHRLMGQILIRMRDYAGAEASLRAAIRLQGKLAGLYVPLLQALFEQKKYAAVRHEAESLPAGSITAEKHQEGAFFLGRAYLLDGQFERAIPLLSGIRTEPQGPYYLGCAYANLGRLEEARTCMDAVLTRQSPFTMSALLQRGHVFLAMGRVAEAESDYREALKYQGANAEALCTLGMLALEKGEIEEALGLLAKAAEAAPGDAAARFALAVCLERRGNVPEALQHYLAVPMDAPEGPRACLRAGVLQCRAEQFAQALACFERYAGHGPEDDTFLFYRGSALAATGKLEAAIRDWSVLQVRQPQNDRLSLNLARAHYQMGSDHLAAGRTAEAIASWDAYLKLYPPDEKTAHDIAELQFRQAAAEIGKQGQADLQRAAAMLRTALDRDPGNATYTFYLALCELRLGQAEASLRRLRSLMEEQGRSPRLLYHVALCLLKTGDAAEAVEILSSLRGEAMDPIYTRCAAWALANEKLRGGELNEAMALLAPETELQVQ